MWLGDVRDDGWGKGEGKAGGRGLELGLGIPCDDAFVMDCVGMVGFGLPHSIVTFRYDIYLYTNTSCRPISQRSMVTLLPTNAASPA